MTATVEPNGLLITGATILTLDDDHTIIDNGAVAIKVIASPPSAPAMIFASASPTW